MNDSVAQGTARAMEDVLNSKEEECKMTDSIGHRMAQGMNDAINASYASQGINLVPLPTECKPLIFIDCGESWGSQDRMECIRSECRAVGLTAVLLPPGVKILDLDKSISSPAVVWKYPPKEDLPKPSYEMSAAGEIIRESVPDGIYYDSRYQNFFDWAGNGKGDEFKSKWFAHRERFPQWMPEKGKPDIKPVEPIPMSVYYNAESDNFYDEHRTGCGVWFHSRWSARRSEFPQSLEELQKTNFVPIPLQIYYIPELDCFYDRNGMRMAPAFESLWKSRKKDFPPPPTWMTLSVPRSSSGQSEETVG